MRSHVGRAATFHAESAATRPLDAASMALVVLLCLTWGFNQPAVKLALPDIPPLIQCAIRSTPRDLLIVLGMHAAARPAAAWRATARCAAGIVAGVLFGFEFLLIYRGLLYTTASRAVLFIYLAPFFVVLGARWFFPGDRFGLMQWAGLAARLRRHDGGVRRAGAGVDRRTSSSAT